MTRASGKGRTDSASIIVQASPHTLYEAFIDPKALVAWLPPKGMSGELYAFDARAGGTYRMALTFNDPEHSTKGKTSEHQDIVEGIFLELIKDERVVQRVEFESDDPEFAGTMTMTWALASVPEGTKVSIICENVPEGIRQEDHDAGLKSTLNNLAAYAIGKERENASMSNLVFVSSLLNGQTLNPAGASIVMAEWSAPGTPAGGEPERIAPLHAHRNDDEAWYVLEGRLAFRIGQDVFEANAGQAVVVPRGAPHTYWNPAPDEARYLIIMTSRIQALIEAIHRTAERDPATMKALFEEYDSEWLE